MFYRIYGLDVCCLRYFNVYGPRQRIGEETGAIPIFVEQALKGQPFTIHGDGSQTRDFLHVKDVVRANLLAAVADTVKGQKIGGGGQEISILELAQLIARLTGKQAKLIFKNTKPGDVHRLVADISRAKQLKILK
jgi:UDP-glucose 4-epimerase